MIKVPMFDPLKNKCPNTNSLLYQDEIPNYKFNPISSRNLKSTLVSVALKFFSLVSFFCTISKTALPRLRRQQQRFVASVGYIVSFQMSGQTRPILAVMELSSILLLLVFLFHFNGQKIYKIGVSALKISQQKNTIKILFEVRMCGKEEL